MRTILYVLFGSIIYFSLKKWYGRWEENYKNMSNRIFFIISIIVTLSLIVGTEYWGAKVPGSFFERTEYENYLYIRLYPHTQEVKSYKVKAKIEATFIDMSDGEGGSEEERVYYINYAIMPNGGKITFYDNDESLKVNEIVEIYDDNRRKWGIELTNELPK